MLQLRWENGELLENRNHQWFDVEELPLVRDDGVAVTGYKAIVRGDTGDTLCVVSKEFTPIQHKLIAEKFEAAMAQSGLDTRGVLWKIDYDGNGAEAFMAYVLPGESMLVGDEEIAMMFLIWNGNNGKLAANGMWGHFRWICSNGGFSGELGSYFRIVHRGSGREELLTAEVNRIVDSAAKYREMIPRMNRWTKIGVEKDAAMSVIKTLKGGNETLHSDLFTRWVLAGDESLWGLYNTLTYWATHIAGRGKVGISLKTQAERGRRVAEVIESKAWRAIEK